MKPHELAAKITAIIAEETSPVAVVVWPDAPISYAQIREIYNRVMECMFQVLEGTLRRGKDADYSQEQ